MPNDEPTPGSKPPAPEDEALTAASSDSRQSPIVRRLGDFEILREIGRGGMGVVYEARQVSLNRRVALKVLPPGLGLTEQAVLRFEREAQAAAKLHHTGIVPVYATGEEDGSHYYAMELIEGQPLSAVLQDLTGSGTNPLMDETVTRLGGGEPTRSGTNHGTSSVTSLSETSADSRKWFDAVAKLTAEVADALHYAHGRGVIHRDIKPANLMLSQDGRLCITDFGLARVVQEPGMTVSGSLMGTPAYMSPEQIASGRMKLDHRTDIYSLGAVLYEMLAHRRPFPGDNREEILGGILTKDPRPPRRFNPRIPVDLETICQRAMEKDPDKRYQTAGEFADDLKRYLGHGLIQARRAGIVKRAWKSIRRHPLASTVTVGVVLLGALAIFTGKTWIGMSQEAAGRQIAEIRHQISRGEFREAMQNVESILSTDPDNVEAVLLRARIHLQQGRFVDCAADARQVLRQRPDDWEAHALYAVAAVRGSLFAVPVDEHLRKVEEAAPDTADAYFLRGSLAQSSWGEEQDRGGPREAIEWLTKALEKDPGHALALQARSLAHDTLKDLPAALADAERLIAALPRSVLGHTRKAAALASMRDLEGALQVANRAIELDPESVHGYEARVFLHDIQGNQPALIEDLARQLELEPGRHQTLGFRGALFRQIGRFDEAIADLERCIEINPDEAGCYWSLMQTHWQAGRREEALGVLEALEDRAKQWVSVAGKGWVSYCRIWYHRENGDLERAEEEATRYIDLIPHKIAGYEERIKSRFRLKGEAGVQEDCDRIAGLDLDLPDELLARASLMRQCRLESVAMNDLDAVIGMAPAWADPYAQRAALHRDMKRYEEALADLDRAIGLAPKWVLFYAVRGAMLQDVERFEDALEDFERAAALGSEFFEFRQRQATVLARLGRDEEALQVLQDYTDKYPNDGQAWKTRANLLFEMGRTEEAIATLDHLLEINPGDETVRAMRASRAAFDPDNCDESAEVFRGYASREAGNPQTWSNIAYVHSLLFFHICPEHYDPEVALENAEKVARLGARFRQGQAAYAATLYRHGSFRESLEVLQQLGDFVPTPNDHELLLSSMNHARLGDPAQARKHYDLAVARIERLRNRRPDTALLRAEAAALLGIEP